MMEIDTEKIGRTSAEFRAQPTESLRVALGQKESPEGH
jgi:hypothetical protein